MLAEFRAGQHYEPVTKAEPNTIIRARQPTDSPWVRAIYAGAIATGNAIETEPPEWDLFDSPKSRAGSRTMSVPHVVVEMLKAHLVSVGLIEDDSNSLLFTDDAGGPLRYSNWRRRVWLPAVKAAGCVGAGFHDLRRLNATSLVVGGVDVKTAQVRLGHSDPRMTLAIYVSAPASADRAAAEVLGTTFFGSSTER